MTEYLGARFYKCDLQMQTPADQPHWQGEAMDIASDPEGVAEAYIQKCYDEGLEIIAITDHNFVSKEFLPYLQKAAKKLKQDYELVIFPGFEFAANVGKGCHVLGLFEPGSNLDQIDHLLTECGVPHPRQKGNGSHKSSTKNLHEILPIIQKRSSEGGLSGLVILPHSQSDDGIFDNDKIAEWLQQSEFTNPNLLCLEVPRSPKSMNVGWQRLFGNGEDCAPEWKRERPIACIMSSDAKSLSSIGDEPTNYIGARYTWIKMSEPSIEALRQAFLDHESRIRLCDDFLESPEKGYEHPHITSVEISGTKFLGDQELIFSPNLNTIIGGRGTGKSTMLEYLRVALGREGEVPDGLLDDFKSLRGTLNDGGSVKLKYNKGAGFEGENWQLHLDAHGEYHINGPSEVGEITEFFPASIFSRGQVETIAKDPAKQRSILDDLIKSELSSIAIQEKQIIGRLVEQNQKLSRESELQGVKNQLLANIADLVGKIRHIEKHGAPLKDWSSWAQEASYIAKIDETGNLASEKLDQILAQGFLDLSQYEGETENQNVLLDYRAHADALTNSFIKDMKQRAEVFRADMLKLKEIDSFVTWHTKFEQNKTEYANALKTLEDSGIDPTEHPKYAEELGQKRAELEGVKVQLAELAKIRTDMEDVIENDLYPLWRDQAKRRQEGAKLLNSVVPQTKIDTPTVNTKVVPFGDVEAFLRSVESIRKDGRRISDSDWKEIFLALFNKSKEFDVFPIDLLREWFSSFAEEKQVEGFPTDISPDKLGVIIGWLDEQAMYELRLRRVPDFVTVELHRREDGKLVGDLASRTLSAGQKATTVLSLLLAKGDTPILIDQPEDDLDNEFVYQQLVPILRECKEHRQIIVVSHNANIPVNGDSELIIPLEVRGSEGCQKEVEGESCVGALDRFSTQTAVEQILEGSAEAFNKRREKYGF